MGDRGCVAASARFRRGKCACSWASFRGLLTSAVMQFGVLGLLEVSDRDRSISLPRGKERALLGSLLALANEPLASEQLIEELWPKQRPENAANAVQLYGSRLRD